MRADLLSQPDPAAYRAATRPHNSTLAQQPAAVAHPTSPEEAAQVVRRAAERNLAVAVQASRHGAAAIGSDQVLPRTSGPDTVHHARPAPRSFEPTVGALIGLVCQKRERVASTRPAILRGL